MPLRLRPRNGRRKRSTCSPTITSRWSKSALKRGRGDGFWRSKARRGGFAIFWIWSGKKVSAALSNDFGRSLQDRRAALVGRWGRQENGFKELKAQGIDRILILIERNPGVKSICMRAGLVQAAQRVRHEIATEDLQNQQRAARIASVTKQTPAHHKHGAGGQEQTAAIAAAEGESRAGQPKNGNACEEVLQGTEQKC